MHRFRDLEIWKLSRVFCKDIYEITSSFPESEKFGLVVQLRRACISIPSNIAEGASRKSNKDFSRFLEIALGSCYEVETQIEIAKDLNFMANDESEVLLSKLTSIIKMISKFITSLNNRNTQQSNNPTIQ